jgi:hypothetical protein
MNHPPLCPKTQEVFALDGTLWWWTVRGLDPKIKCCDETPAADRFVARYQACAWQDRADRWDAVACRMDNDDYRWHFAADALYRCEDIARAWREWEKSHEDPA